MARNDLLDFSFGWDTGSLQKLVELAGFSALLDPEITEALTWAGELVVTTARSNTWEVFDNPTGRLASAIYFHVTSPKEVEVGVRDIPYARRREMGFLNMTDSLGRFYPNDHERPYLLPAVQEDQWLIADRMELAVDRVLERISLVGGGIP